jgi:hypothetical protein
MTRGLPCHGTRPPGFARTGLQSGLGGVRTASRGLPAAWPERLGTMPGIGIG